ncbi:D-alanyl-D-alanine carboxypeptidase family protein [Cellulomonas alba]|uniref:D-alanyl-D-alanine carboxypeptidase family protein n=1 Tax=Cellulomonas alba TaxID=3053467 RepID=A0ABT7SGN6_9CELL|nr:D-alanyl-D-alanine carboxypeptidase family protein [Cellulomonas alba]MDM7855336.1 D-alanyl-D-alanine carboxypeptidase family protein [Cellulomonas alba]
MSNRKRRPAHRAEPVRSPLAARVHDLTPARLAQGGVVAVLVAGLCTTITAQASASGTETDSGRTAAMAEARDGAVDVAADALVVADAVQTKAAHTTGVSAAKLAELRTAAAQVDALITEAEGHTSTASDTRDAGGTPSPSASADAPAPTASPSASTPSAMSSPSATASGAPADAAEPDAANPAASPTAAPVGSDESPSAADADPASDTAAVAPPTVAPSTAASSTAATSTAGRAAGATVPGATVAGAAKAAPPAPASASAETPSPSSTATTGTPSATGTATAAAGTTATGTTPAGTSPTAFDAKVPTIPDTAGPEDQTTEDLRTAVAHLATIAAEVRAEVADEAARQAADKSAADKSAADKAAAQKTAADKKAADQAAAEKAAERKAAQRAAWKRSLQGFPNGRIPASALCGVPFDSSVLLRCDAAQALTALDKAYSRAFGHHLEVSDSYRSYGAQVACRATKGYLCAEPGTSNHGWGVAVDLGGGIQSFGTSTHGWMNRNAAKFGWHHPGWAEPGGSKPEPWHWEFTA